MEKRWFYSFAFLAIIALVNFACRKTEMKENPKQIIKKTAISKEELHIDAEEVYAALPPVFMHNIDAKLYVGRAQWKAIPNGVMIRIPASRGNNKYIYATKTLDDPGKVNVYAVKYNPTLTSTDKNFSGTKFWIDFQDWTTYGLEYENNTIVKHMEPQPLAETGWEERATAYGHFYLNANGMISVNGDCNNAHGGEHLVTYGGGPYKCPEDINGGGGSWLGRLFANIGNWLGNVFRDDGDEGSSGTPSGTGPIWVGGWNPPPTGLPDGDGGTGGWSDPTAPGGPSPADPNPLGNPVYLGGNNVTNTGTIYDPNNTVGYLHSVLGLNSNQVGWLNLNLGVALNLKTFWLLFYPGVTQQQKKDIALEHLNMMITNPDYLNQINNLTGNWWDRDQNGFVTARKIQMELYLQANPKGMLDCNNINQLPMNMYQAVGSYQVPSNVLDRLSQISSSQPGTAYSSTYFGVQDINNASGGIVNCDYFAVHITQLPQYTNGTTMTPDQFLEYFRLNINSFTGQPVNGASFAPYFDDDTYLSGTVHVDDALKFNSSYENSLGALIHIHIPLQGSGLTNDGTVVESGYLRESVNNRHWFMFSTMKTPLDGEHPVAGNRKFGIFPDPNGGYCFYTMGVDRLQDATISLDFTNTSSSVGFTEGDALWTGMQTKTTVNINSWQGNATIYTPVIVRPEWDTVSEFLKGHITFQELKTALHCP